MEMENEVIENTENNETGEPSFEELLKQSEASAFRRISVGEQVEGKIVQLSKDVAFVDIGRRAEARLPMNLEDERCAALQVGGTSPFFVVQASGEVVLSLDPVIGFGDISIVREASASGKPVEGRVAAAIKGGYEVNVAGIRCFCPISQIDARPVQDPKTMVGQTLEFKVLEFDEDRKNVVVSRRALLDEVRSAKESEARDRIKVGAVVHGKVVEFTKFGAFVDLEGLVGLIHVSEISHQRVNQASDVLKIDQEVEVKVLDMSKDDKNRDRISLSLKALQPDPFSQIEAKRGDRLMGRIARKSDFGIFVNLFPGIDGLIPLRFLKKAGQSLAMDDFRQGAELEVEIVEISFNDRKITLAIPGWAEEIKSNYKVGESLKATVVKIIPAGLIVQAVGDPAKGLIPKRFFKNVASPKQLSKQFAEGAELEVVLEEIDERGRYTFGLKTAESEVDNDTVKQFTEKPKALGHNPFANFFSDQK